jgi:hypothetical protein
MRDDGAYVASICGSDATTYDYLLLTDVLKETWQLQSASLSADSSPFPCRYCLTCELALFSHSGKGRANGTDSP